MEIKSDSWQIIKSIKKVPIIAEIGGFRPLDNDLSWFGGNFMLDPNDQWTSDDNGHMIPLIQLYIPDIPNGKDLFGDILMIQVFLNKETLPIHTSSNGEKWLLKEYTSINHLQKTETPSDVQIYKPFPIHWHTSDQPDYPCWEEAWDYANLDDINESDELSDLFFDTFTTYERTKIGGYASYIQSPPYGDYSYVFQVCSEDKPKFLVGDSGNLYFYRHNKSNEWYMSWDCF